MFERVGIPLFLYSPKYTRGIAVSLLLWFSCSAAAVTIQAIPSANVVLKGESLSIAVVVSGLDGLSSSSLGAFDLNLQFDPDMFGYNGHTLGPGLGDGAAGESITDSSTGVGNLSVYQISLLVPSELNANQPATFTLFNATFDAMGSGAASFSLFPDSSPGDELGNPLSPMDYFGADVLVLYPVSIPTLGDWTLLLMMVAVFGLGITALRRRMP